MLTASQAKRIEAKLALHQEALKKLPPEAAAAFYARMKWLMRAHAHQIPPKGDWWTIWLLLAGRGAGKTRTAAEDVWHTAWTTPNIRILISGPTSADIRDTMIEGESGLLNCMPEEIRVKYTRSLHEIVLTNGSLIKGIPASEPERFRGPQWHHAWCCIAGTKILMSDGQEKNIEDVRAGHWVMTRHGAKKVLAAGPSGNPNQLIKISFGGTSLTLTEDHPILIGDQWIPAGKVSEGDLLWVTSTSTENMRTEWSTSSILGRYPKVGSFITRTKTLQTTILKTWSQCLERIIAVSMPDQPQKNKRSLLPRLCAGIGNQKLVSAFNVIPVLFPSRLVSQGSFAPQHAGKGGETILSSRKSDPAWFAKAHTWLSKFFRNIVQRYVITSQNTERIALRQKEVLLVERFPNLVTFGIKVDDVHEFIANGVVVHNCDELAAWEYLDSAWDQIMFSVRLGEKPRIVVTTTPKPKPLIIDLLNRDGEDVVVTQASTYDNLANLAGTFKQQILQYEGTSLGRQEIHAEIIDPEEAGIIKRAWIKLWPSEKPFPRFEFIVQSYDGAYTEKTINDPSACSVWGIFKPSEDKGFCAMLIDCWEEHLQYPDLKEKVIEDFGTVYGDPNEFGQGKKTDMVLVEDKSSGISLLQDLGRAHIPCRSYNPGGADKVQRVNLIAPLIKAGKVYIPESTKNEDHPRSWAEPLVNQLCAFPEVRHDDLVDTVSQALRVLRDMGWLNIDPPPPEDDPYPEDRPKRVNPYAA